MNCPILSSDKVRLEPLTEAHCNENYLSWFADQEVSEYIESSKQAMSIQSLKDFIQKNIAEGNLFWAIHSKPGGHHIGNIKIDRIRPAEKTAEYGILLGDKNSWGKGFSRESSNLVIAFCFQNLGLETITLGFVEGNARALHLYRSLGFEVYDILKGYSEYRGGNRDVIRMKLEKSKWIASKIILGTAQMGMPYGINNQMGQVSRAESFRILETAYARGIRILDTAPVYGNSLEVIADFHKEKGKKFNIITKFHLEQGSNPQKDIEKTLASLGINSLFCYQYHRSADIHDKMLPAKLIALKEKGLLKKIGVSVYTAEEIKDAIAADWIDIIQLPFNALDNMSLKAPLLLEAKQSGKSIHARSVFLQGLFFKDPSLFPGKLASLVKPIEELHRIAAHSKISLNQLALYYVLQNQLIDGTLIGVDSLNQLNENLSSLDLALLPEVTRQIEKIAVPDSGLLNPVNWS